MEVMIRLGQLCFAYGRKRHFYGSGNITQYITTTFNSPRWRPTRRTPRILFRMQLPRQMCRFRVSFLEKAVLHCEHSNSTRDGDGGVGGGGGTARTSDYKNKRTNESFSHVIYNNSRFLKLLTRKIEICH